MKYTTITTSLFLLFFTFSTIVLSGQDQLNSQFSADQTAAISTNTSFHYMAGESQQSGLPPESLSEAMRLLPNQSAHIASLQIPYARKRKTKVVEGLLIGLGAGMLVAQLTRPEPCEPSLLSGLCEASRAAHYSGIMLLGTVGGGLVGLMIKNRTTTPN